MNERTWEIPHVAFSKTKTMVFMDFETTGFTPWKAARIIEYSAIKVTPTETTVFQMLAKPFAFSKNSRIRIPSKIEELTRITNEMVENEVDTFTAFRDFYDFTHGNICIAHNAKFEYAFYQWYCDFLHLDNDCIFRDTMPMFKEKYKVAALSKITQSENAHMAFDDCVSMIKLMKECQNEDPKLLNLMEVVELSENTKSAIFENLNRGRR